MALDTRGGRARGTAVVLQGSGLSVVPGGAGPVGLSDLRALVGDAPGAVGRPEPSADAESLRTGELSVRTPLVLGVSPGGFECRDHDGRLVVTLSAAELAAASELRRAS